jgi:S1-C subfamily serine protease
VATAAHILGNQQTCGGRIRLIDWRGREHSATLEGLSTADDLALLRISDTSLSPLQLADSAAYETPREMVSLVTLGFPLEEAGGSAPDSVGFSGQGNLSRFDREQNAFITSGLNLNPGNSGGPVFVLPSWQVLGIASAKLREDIGAGIGYVVPIRTFETFFRDKTGEALR